MQIADLFLRIGHTFSFFENDWPRVVQPSFLTGALIEHLVDADFL